MLKYKSKMTSGDEKRCSTMGWEKRGNGLYYYRKKRVGQRVKSEYMGTDSLADLYFAMDNKDRYERHITQTEWSEQRLEADNLEADTEHLDEVIGGLVRAVLLTSGYHLHKGQWRKARHA